MTLPPTPPPSAATATMRANRSANTRPELALRRALHRLGYRYRIGTRVRLPTRSIQPDITFPRRRVAVFVDGCFWHACPAHGRRPSDPTGYWAAKLARNQARDKAVDEALRLDGWNVVRVWEHESIEAAVEKVARAVDSAVSTAGKRHRPG